MEVSAVSHEEHSNRFRLHFAQICSACCGPSKSVRREFSAQAWQALVYWEEITAKSVDQPLCNDCYFNLRDVLIERASEVSSAAKTLSTMKNSAVNLL